MRSYTFPTTGVHEDILILMRVLGYPGAKVLSGVCNGLQLAGAHACEVEGGIEAFNERIKFITENKNALVKDIERIKKELAERSASGLPLDLNEYEQKIIDVIAFFDAVELTAFPVQHTDTFGGSYLTQEHFEETSAMTHPLQLGSGLKIVERWVGAYETQAVPSELSQYFTMLNEMASTADNSFTLSMNNREHAFALHYHALSRQWLLVDANRLPIKPVQLQDLAAMVKEICEERGKWVILSTSLLLSSSSTDLGKEKQAALLTKINQMQYHVDSSGFNIYQSLHRVTQTKIEAETARGNTLLANASNNGHLETIRAILHELKNTGLTKNDISLILQKQNMDGITPCMCSALGGFGIDFISILINEGFTQDELLPLLNAKSKDGRTPLMCAVTNGYINFISDLVNKGFTRSELWLLLNDIDIHGLTTFMWAAAQGKANIISVLMAVGFTKDNLSHLLHMVDKDGETSLHHVFKHGHATFITALHNIGFTKEDLLPILHMPDKDGKTSLHHAILQSDINLDIMTALQSAGFTKNDFLQLFLKPDREGKILFYHAVSHGRANIILFLKEAGFKRESFLLLVNEKNTEGWSQVVYDIFHGATFPNLVPAFIEAGLTKQDFIHYLTEENSEGYTIVTEAVKNRDLYLIDFLIESGFTKNDFSQLLNVPDNNGWTPIMYAAMRGDIEIFVTLKDIGFVGDDFYSLINMEFIEAASKNSDTFRDMIAALPNTAKEIFFMIAIHGSDNKLLKIFEGAGMDITAIASSKEQLARLTENTDMGTSGHMNLTEQSSSTSSSDSSSSSNARSGTYGLFSNSSDHLLPAESSSNTLPSSNSSPAKFRKI